MKLKVVLFLQPAGNGVQSLGGGHFSGLFVHTGQSGHTSPSTLRVRFSTVMQSSGIGVHEGRGGHVGTSLHTGQPGHC